MIVRIFRTNQIYIFAFVLLVLLILRAPSIYNVAPISADGYFPVIEQVFIFLNTWPILSYLLGITLILFQGVIISGIGGENQLFIQNSNLPAFVLALMYSMVSQLNWISPSLVASTFLVLALKQIISIYNQKSVDGEVFRTGILIGLASLFYLPSIGMFVVLFYNLSIFRTFHWKEYVISIFGVMSIYFYVLSYYLLTDQVELLITDILQPELYFNFISPNWIQWSLYSIFIILILFSYGILMNTIQKRTIRINNVYKVLSIFFFTPALFAVFFLSDLLSILILILPPFSIIISNFLLNISRKWIGEFVIYIILILIVLREVIEMLI